MSDPRDTSPSGRPRARGLGLPFDGEPGAYNAITDVAGVEVGYRTLIDGEDCRTGVTAILPRGRGRALEPVAAGLHSFNGNGEMTGSHWIREAGKFSGPVCITNTGAIGAVHDGVSRWLAANHPTAPGTVRWFLPVVAETWDGVLNNVEAFHVAPRHAAEAIEAAVGGPIAEGNVGGGTGMRCYGWKGGSGTASRRTADNGWTVGAFVQANFGRREELMVRGIALGGAAATPADPAAGAGSIIVVLATEAPLDAAQLSGLARRATIGIGRTGTSGHHESGDIFLAFSTASPQAGAVRDAELSMFFTAAAQAVEEAILNALVGAETLTGFLGHAAQALPHDIVRRAAARLAKR
jgi:L-aminopeptidase/D-esterase-like protein